MAVDNASTTEFINKIFPTEASLVAVDPLIYKLRNKIRRVDAEILAAVRQQSSSGSKAKEDLAVATQAIEELTKKMCEIKLKGEQSEVMVQELCRDIKKLDYAKKHITTSITALHRLSMLVSAIDQVEGMAAKRQYKKAAGQLEAVNQLCSHFEGYSDIPKISELREKFKAIKLTLKTQLFADFSSLGTAGLKENGGLMQQLADGCLVIDALDFSAREELVRNVCSKELTAYQQIFQGTEVAKLDKIERRYAWIKRQLRAQEEIWQIFPPSWQVAYLLCIQFCKVTRAQLMEILDSLKEKPDVQIILQALQRTLEFEEELADRFGYGKDGSSGGDGKATNDEAEETEGDNRCASAIRMKYEKELAAKAGQIVQPNSVTHIAGGKEDDLTLASKAALRMNFHGIISSCFEPHLHEYVELEEKTLMETLEKLVQEELWEAEEGSQTNILSSSTQVFSVIKRSLKRCSALTKNQTLFDLFKVFQRVLRAYAGKLSARLPKVGTGIVAVATNIEGQLKISDKDERVICYIVNTAEYCYETAAQLAENMSNLIDAQYFDRINMSEEQGEFSGVITRALSTLVLGLETKLENELLGMTRMPWATLESVGDQSE